MGAGSEPCFGNAAADSTAQQDWLVGHFVRPETSLRHSREIELKWGTHRAGEERAEWAAPTTTTISILVRGRMRIRLRDREFVLQREGDYLMLGPDTPHTWRAEEDSLILTVRWPSRPAPAEGRA